MSRRVLSAATAALTGSILLASCSTGPAASPASVAAPAPAPASAGHATGPVLVTITSDDVPMPSPQSAVPAAGAAARIVSLATGVGETLVALGVGDRVVGRDETSNVPAIADVPVVTKAHATSAERVLSTKPDLVLVDATTSPPEALDQIRSAGVRVVEVPEAWTLTDIDPRTRAVAAAVGVDTAVADAVVAEATSGAVTPQSGTRPRVAFLYLRGTSAIYLVGGKGSGADALIEAAGGVDAGADAGLAAFVPLTAEAVATLDPDVLLVMTKGLESVGGVDGLVGLPGVAQTPAGRNRRVVSVEDTLLLSFGPRTGQLVTRLADAIHQAAG